MGVVKGRGQIGNEVTEVCLVQKKGEVIKSLINLLFGCAVLSKTLIHKF